MSLTGAVAAVSVGRRGELVAGRRRIESAFVKSPVTGRVRLTRTGFEGDEHVYEDHGGPDMALLVYSVDHYPHWRSLGLDLPAAGAFGENLTVTGLVETDVRLGDIFELGSAVVQICQPRSPCYKLAARYDRKDMAVLVQDTGFTGYLLRVLSEGDVAAGDLMTLVRRDSDHQVTVAEAARILNVDRNDHAGALRVLEVESLGASTRKALRARVESGGGLGLHTERLLLPESEQR